MLLHRRVDSRRMREAHGLIPVSFDEAYPDVRKEFYTPALKVDVPEASVIPSSRTCATLTGSTYTIPEDYVATLKGAHYCTTNNVIMPAPGRILVESMNGEATLSKSLAPIPLDAYASVEEISGWATLFDSNFNGYYHQLVEVVPRLLALNRRPYTDIDEIKLICPRGIYKIVSLLMSRLGQLNLRPVVVERGGIFEVERLLFTPFKTRQFAGYLPPRYVKELREAFLPKRPSARCYRIFISRERSVKRRLRNQDALEHALSRRGFEKYVLEDLSPEEHIELFYDAEAVVGTHGAGLTNVLFSPHVKVLELFPRNFVEPHYLFLCKSLGHEYRFWRNSARWDLEYIAWRLRQRLERVPAPGNGLLAGSRGRSINLAYSVNVDEVVSILDEMGIH